MVAVASVLYLAGTAASRLGVHPGIFWTFGQDLRLCRFVIIWLVRPSAAPQDQLQRFAWVGLTPLALR